MRYFVVFLSQNIWNIGDNGSDFCILCANPLEEHCNFDLTHSCSRLSSEVQQQP